MRSMKTQDLRSRIAMIGLAAIPMLLLELAPLTIERVDGLRSMQYTLLEIGGRSS